MTSYISRSRCLSLKSGSSGFWLRCWWNQGIMSSSNNEWSSCIYQGDSRSSEAQRTALTTLLSCSEGEVKHISLSLSKSPKVLYLSCHLQQPQKAHDTLPWLSWCPGREFRIWTLKSILKSTICRRHSSLRSSASPFHWERVSGRQPHPIGRTGHEFAGLPVLIKLPFFWPQKRKSLDGARFS